MVNKGPFCLIGLLVGMSVSHLSAIDAESPWIAVEFPRDSPIIVTSARFGPNQSGRVRGMSMTSDLHGDLLLRNSSTKVLAGLTLRIDSPNLGLALKASITLPSLRTAPGETVPIRIDAALVQPISSENLTGASVSVSLDCAEFSDGSTFGPDTLDTEQQLQFYRAEAERDRKYLAGLLSAGQLPRLREALNFGLLDTGRALAGMEVLPPETADNAKTQPSPIMCRNYDSSPVSILDGTFHHVRSQLRGSRVTVRNRSAKPIKNVEVGYLVGSPREGLFFAGTVPSAASLAPGQQINLAGAPPLRVFESSGEPSASATLVAFVARATFSDGSLWIPSRDDLQSFTVDPALRRALSFSPEQQRLAELYHRDSISAVISDLQEKR